MLAIECYRDLLKKRFETVSGWMLTKVDLCLSNVALHMYMHKIDLRSQLAFHEFRRLNMYQVSTQTITTNGEATSKSPNPQEISITLHASL